LASITTLTSAEVATFVPYSSYAAAGYCAASDTLAWSCGALCNANPKFIPVASGGDGDATQYWYVGYDPTLETVIVSHQGTTPSQIESLVTDGTFSLNTLNSTLFPGVSTSIEVHSGFGDEQAKTATVVLAAVKATMKKYTTTSVVLTGHSLGAAISLLDSVYLPLNLPETTTFKTIVYGLPRVGNQAFADYIDANTPVLTHVNNMEDFVPILPGRFLGFVHPSGEVHITDSSAWLACPGQDNDSTECTRGDVSNIFEGSESEHDGPYNDVIMKCVA